MRPEGCAEEPHGRRDPWQKVLWREQPGYPDNHTDATFLRSLSVSVQPERDFWRVVRGSAAVTQQMSTVAIACAAANYLLEERIAAHKLLQYDALLVAALGAGCVLGGARPARRLLLRGLRQCTLLMTGVYLLSPLLQTLTRTISTDTIVATTAYLLLIHLYLHDYNFVNNVTDKLTGSVSLGASVFASVLLASRLRSQAQVFAQVLVSLQLYLLSPYVRRYLRQAAPAAYAVLTVVMPLVAMGLLAPLSLVLMSAFLAAVLFVSLLCPFWLVRIHKFKAKINGPWDEAVPELLSSLEDLKD